MDFTDHYTVLDEGLFPTREAARNAAGGDNSRVWFVRHGDGSDDDEEEVWDVQTDFGQFVNCAGFFVTVEPCKPEHTDTIFTY